MMDFRLLGPFEVVRDGMPVALGGRRQRAVLALLTLHAGEVVTTDRIAEQIWAGDPPPSATRTVHSYVSRLRAALRVSDGSGPDRLVRREPGYVLDIDPATVDAVRFERLVDDAVAALDAGDPGSANAALREGLGLWRGEALADFAYDFFAATESLRLDGRRLEALELRIDTDLALGRHAQVVAELESLVVDQPLRERFWAQLIVALYRCGRQADALAAYTRVRRTLVEELGLEPGEELRLLEAQVLDQSEALALPGLPPGAGRHGVAPVGDRRPSRGIPLPDRLHIRPEVGVIGRAAQIGRIEEAARSAASGEGRAVLLISGEAGQGKSTLVAEAARRAFDGGAHVLSGHCEQDVSAPYQLFVETLGHYALHAPDDELLAAVDEQVTELGPLLPPLARRVPAAPAARAVDPDTERYKLFAAVVDLVSRIAAERTLVLVLDDLQWADQGSLQLLRHLVTSDRPMRLVVLATYRDSELAVSDPLVETLGALRRAQGVERIELPGFDRSDVLSIMEAIAEQAMDDQGITLANAIHAETDGNPLFVGEVLRHLFEVGALHRDQDGRWVGPEGADGASLPEGVREVIDARVVRLGRESAANLSLAAVIGRDFDLDLLLAAAETTPDELLDTLEAAATAALVREPADMPGWYSFTHALIQRTLYEGMGASRRTVLHRKVFDVLRQWSEGGAGARASSVAAGEVARHLVASARPDESDTVVHYARLAAEEAMSALNPDGAVGWYTTALEALGDGADATRAQVLGRLGDAQRQTGDHGFRATLLEAARLALGTGDDETLVYAALANSRQIQSTTGNVDEERVAVLEAAIERVGTEDTAERAMLLAHLAVDRSYDGEPERRRLLVEEALGIARRVGDPATLFDVLLRRVGIWMPEDVGERLAESAEALAVAEALDDPVARFWALFYRSIVAAEAGDRALLDECRGRFPEEARATGQPLLQWSTTYAEGWQRILEGDLEGAELRANQALELGGALGQPDAMAIYGGQIVDLRWHQGRDAELVELIEQMVVSTPDIDSFRAALARIYADIGRSEDARALLLAETAANFAHPFDPLAGTTIVMWAEVAIQTADTGAADVLLRRLATFADQVVCNGVDIFGSLDHYRGALLAVLGDLDGAEDKLLAASAVHEGLRAPFFEARTHLELARLLRRRGGPGDAAEAARRAGLARDLARKYGYATVERRAVELAGT